MSTALVLLSQAYSLMWVPTVPAAVWIVAGVAVWLVVAVAVAGWVGRVVRNRDRQQPSDEQLEADIREALEMQQSRVDAAAAFDRFWASRHAQHEREAHERYVADDWRGED